MVPSVPPCFPLWLPVYNGPHRNPPTRRREHCSMTAANTLPIFDGHNDTLLSLYERERGDNVTFFDRSEKGHIDLPRAREGGLAGGFFAVFVPDPAEEHPADQPDPPASGYELPLPPSLDGAYAQRTAITLSASLFRIEAASQ